LILPGVAAGETEEEKTLNYANVVQYIDILVLLYYHDEHHSMI
jgi:hypothetical protein